MVKQMKTSRRKKHNIEPNQRDGSQNHFRYISTVPQASAGTVLDVDSHKTPSLGVSFLIEHFLIEFEKRWSLSIGHIFAIEKIGDSDVLFRGFIQQVDSCGYIKYLQLESFERCGIVVALDSKLAHNIIDAYLGGTDQAYSKTRGRHYTEIDLAVLDELSQIIVASFDFSLAQVGALALRTSDRVINPEFLTRFLSELDGVRYIALQVKLSLGEGLLKIAVTHSLAGHLNSRLCPKAG